LHLIVVDMLIDFDLWVEC